MRHSIHNVRQLHVAFGLPVSDIPTVGDKAGRQLRAKLLVEELCEVLDELGVAAEIKTNGYTHQFWVAAVKEDHEIHLGNLTKELSDLDYVNQGTCVSMGLPAEAMHAANHRSNMSKLDENGKPIMREDGKFLKGPNYLPVQVDHVMEDSRGTFPSFTPYGCIWVMAEPLAEASSALRDRINHEERTYRVVTPQGDTLFGSFYFAAHATYLNFSASYGMKRIKGVEMCLPK